MWEKYLIRQTPYWDISLGKDQTYLGYCILFLRRPCPDLDELTEDELIDFHSIIKSLQTAIKSTFGATMFNWSCLMNNAYRKKKDPQVHWHMQPRYDHEVTFNGKTFKDPNFGHYAVSGDEPLLVSEDMEKELINAIKENLKL